MTTQPHEMEKRIRFGSDGNGIFVAVSADGGKTWRLFDDVKAFAVTPVDLIGLRGLTPDEFMMGVKFLRGEWVPGKPCYSTLAVDIAKVKAMAPPEPEGFPENCTYCHGIGACPKCWGRAAITRMESEREDAFERERVKAEEQAWKNKYLTEWALDAVHDAEGDKVEALAMFFKRRLNHRDDESLCVGDTISDAEAAKYIAEAVEKYTAGK